MIIQMMSKTEPFHQKKKAFEMIRFTTISQWRKHKNTPETAGKTIGFVPTMGALHSGHLSLIKKSKTENDLTIVSIFINKPQFNDKSDYVDYPRNIEKDVQLLKTQSTDFLLIPEYKELYSDDYQFKITEKSFSKLMEGKHRPGHFDGVLTVVMKLLIGIAPSKSYFGEKDFQQYYLIRDMAKSFLIETKIVVCPTIRNIDGLAESSRNALLSPSALKKASLFFKELSSTKTKDKVFDELKKLGFDVEYIEEFGGRRFGAVNIDNVRLIDNIEKKHSF